MKTTRASLTLVSLLPVTALILAACAADTADPGAETSPRPGALSAPRAHLLPMPGAARPFHGAASGTAHMVYRGGPVISSVKVYAVFWGASVPNQSALDGYYGALVSGPYIDLLSEYDTATQQIGRGKFIGSYLDSAAPTGSSLSDDQIQQEIGRLLDAGSLPAADANTLFMLHFPPGVSITMDGNTSCQQFCAYHSSFTHGGGSVYYGIMPDFSGACASCGGESTQLDGTTVVASHEVAEAITDPNIGVANQTQDEHQLGWYDDTNSEIGDVCEGQSATVEGYRVTKLWSNKANACAVTGEGSTGTGAGGGPGGGGTGAGGSPGGGGACSHPICATGAALSPSCGPCTHHICDDNPECCSSGWTAACVQQAGPLCGKSCP